MNSKQFITMLTRQGNCTVTAKKTVTILSYVVHNIVLCALVHKQTLPCLIQLKFSPVPNSQLFRFYTTFQETGHRFPYWHALMCATLCMAWSTRIVQVMLHVQTFTAAKCSPQLPHSSRLLSNKSNGVGIAEAHRC